MGKRFDYLNEEQFHGFEFLMYPSDFFSLRVLEAIQLQEAVPVASAKAPVLRRQPDGVIQEKQEAFFNVQLASLTQPFLPYLPGLSLSTLNLCRSGGRAVSVQQVLDDWGLRQPAESCLVVPLPETLLQMVLRGFWQHVPCLGRWHNLLHQLCEADQRRVGWPGNCAPQAADGSLSQTKVLELVKTLQSWAPVLLQDSDEGQEGHERKLELLGAVRWLLNVRAALPGDSDVLPCRGVVYDSMFLVRCLLMSRLMPAYVSWKEVCVHSLKLLFPDLLKDSLKHLLESKHLFPGEGSKHKMRLVLDVALLLWKRKKEEQEGPFVRFAGADSSPQHGNNWLLSSCISVRQSKMLEVFRCLQRMIHDCRHRSQSDHDEGEQSAQSRADHAVVYSCVQQEHDLPVVLGSGAEGTAHKCAAMLHKWVVLLGDSNRLPMHLNSFFSFCSDMGAELGIGHFHVQDFMSLLPPWQRHEQMEVDLLQAAQAVPEEEIEMNLESDVQIAAPVILESDLQPGPEALPSSRAAATLPAPLPDVAEDWAWQPSSALTTSSSLFLPNAVVVPGLLHIVNNALVEVAGQLSHFETFFEQLG